MSPQPRSPQPTGSPHESIKKVTWLYVRGQTRSRIVPRVLASISTSTAQEGIEAFARRPGPRREDRKSRPQGPSNRMRRPGRRDLRGSGWGAGGLLGRRWCGGGAAARRLRERRLILQRMRVQQRLDRKEDLESEPDRGKQCDILHAGSCPSHATVTNEPLDLGRNLNNDLCLLRATHKTALSRTPNMSHQSARARAEPGPRPWYIRKHCRGAARALVCCVVDDCARPTREAVMYLAGCDMMARCNSAPHVFRRMLTCTVGPKHNGPSARPPRRMVRSSCGPHEKPRALLLSGLDASVPICSYFLCVSHAWHVYHEFVLGGGCLPQDCMAALSRHHSTKREDPSLCSKAMNTDRCSCRWPSNTYMEVAAP